MKIDIITFHNTSNFGATLQCAALSTYFTKKGHDVEVINYLPSYVANKKSVFKELKKVKTSNNKIKAFVKGIAYIAFSSVLKKKDAKFEDFIRSNLQITIAYPDYDSITKDPPEANLFVCGSDQIWNPVLTGGILDPAFFLMFTDGYKASYGASIGEMDLQKYSDQLLELTKDFSALSVREKSVSDRLSEILNRKVSAVLDCTLLLDKSDYERMERHINNPDNPYLLLYNVQGSKQSTDIAIKIATDKQLQIIDISPNPFAKINGAKKIIDIGPGEFLSYVKNAEYVVTNSFHGSVFSIIYEKNFTSIPHSTRSGRVVELLNMLGLESRLSQNSSTIDSTKIDYDQVYKKLAECRKTSFRYLETLLENAK